MAKLDFIVLCREAAVEDGPPPPNSPPGTGPVRELVIRGIVGGVFRHSEGLGVLHRKVVATISGLARGNTVEVRGRFINGNGNKIKDDTVKSEVPPHGVIDVWFDLTVHDPSPPGIEGQISVDGKPVGSRVWPVV